MPFETDKERFAKEEEEKKVKKKCFCTPPFIVFRRQHCGLKQQAYVREIILHNSLMKTYNEVDPTGLGQGKRRKTQPQSNLEQRDELGWPQSLLDFVNDSFERAESLDAPSRAIFDQQIQQLIYNAAKEGKVWSNPWNLQQLPIFNHSVPLCLVQDASVPLSPVSRLKGQKNPQKSKRFDSQERKNQRNARFGSPDVKARPDTEPIDPNKPIVGTLTALEKRYLRLTSAPDPSTVRPQKALEKSLNFVLDNFRNSDKLYLYINDQLKAIRQDLTVQHIKNDFTVKVYEIHGRIAIEHNDLGEFNQCLSQLRYLYSLNTEADHYKHTYEFQCYQALYFLITGNNSGVNSIILDLLDRDNCSGMGVLSQKFVTHRQCLYRTLELLPILTQGDYHMFFFSVKWFEKQTLMPCAFHLINNFLVAKERILALSSMSKAYKRIPIKFIMEELAYKQRDEFLRFCEEHKLADYVQDQEFDCGNARGKLQTISNQSQFKKIDIKGQV